jgi:hypothetical protein
MKKIKDGRQIQRMQESRLSGGSLLKLLTDLAYYRFRIWQTHARFEKEMDEPVTHPPTDPFAVEKLQCFRNGMGCQSSRDGLAQKEVRSIAPVGIDRSG